MNDDLNLVLRTVFQSDIRAILCKSCLQQKLETLNSKISEIDAELAKAADTKQKLEISYSNKCEAFQNLSAEFLSAQVLFEVGSRLYLQVSTCCEYFLFSFLWSQLKQSPKRLGKIMLVEYDVVFSGRLREAEHAAPSLKRWQFGAVGSDVAQINEVTLRRARLVLG